MRRLLTVGLAGMALLPAACGGSGAEIDVSTQPLNLRPVAPSLGGGPWSSEDVEEFVRPAYEAQAENQGPLAVLQCMEGGALAGMDTSDPALFTCFAFYQSGTQSRRVLRFASSGTLVDEKDITPSTERVNPGVQCSTGAGADFDDLPDCEDVYTERETRTAPPPNRNLYGTAEGPIIRAGQPGNPRKCPAVNGELVQAVRFSCTDAVKVARYVTKVDRCQPPADGNELRCTVKPLKCVGRANADPLNPWSASCVIGRDDDRQPYVRFYVPVP